MNYGPSHAPRYNPTLPNYAALATLQNRAIAPATGADAPVVPGPTEKGTWEKVKETLEKPNETVFNIPNKYLLGGAVALGGIAVLHQMGAFDKLVGGKPLRSRR